MHQQDCWITSTGQTEIFGADAVTDVLNPNQPVLFQGGAMGWPHHLLRAEGAALAAASIAAYSLTGGSLGLFLSLILIPDVALLAYIKGPRWGAFAYNLTHGYATPLALGTASYVFGQTTFFLICLIFIAHIGIDRLLGFGLKYASAFGDTHLGQLSVRRRSMKQPH
jgi:hypothetical protein